MHKKDDLMTFTRTLLSAVAVAAAALLVSPVAFAQAYPTKPVKVVVPFPPAAPPTSWPASFRPS